jgi:hypothetical protein
LIVALVSFASDIVIVPVDTAWLYEAVAEKSAYALNDITPNAITATPLRSVHRPGRLRAICPDPSTVLSSLSGGPTRLPALPKEWSSCRPELPSTKAPKPGFSGAVGHP